MQELVFPNNFMFGAATSSYQIEGAVNEDGRGPSVWDEFSHRKGKILGGDNGDAGCGHYHRYAEDVGLMGQLGLDAYRFSLSWSRIIPEGTGKVNQAGLDFYKRLIDAQLEAGITPYATLFHWDMPLTLKKRYGGFLNRQAAHDYADYVDVVVRELGDRVKHWITVNEPWEHGCLGHVTGDHAPGYHRPWQYMRVMHHQLLAHGLGMARIRERCPEAEVGAAVSLTPIHANSDRDKDHRAAAIGNEFMNGICLDPLLKGHYPDELSRRFRWFAPDIKPGDMEAISAPADFIGVNNYQREFARHSSLVPFLNAWIVGGGAVAETDFVKDGVQHTSMGWEVYPQAIYECLKWLQRDYGNPRVLVTENGAAFDDVLKDGVVDDPKRIDYLHGYMGQVHKALMEGANVDGYFAWSLLDNFEWAAGYAKRFGLIHVDYQTQQRTIKNSGLWYRDLIARSHG